MDRRTMLRTAVVGAGALALDPGVFARVAQAFSPDGGRLYFSSQRGNSNGITYEVRSPFR